MKKFILLLNNDDNEPQYEIVEAESEKAAMAAYLTELFFLDDEELSERYIAESMVDDDYFGVAEVEVGPFEFSFYDLSDLGL